ncbi:unnamed protein product [Fusarium graminearum]|nr:unnamed protein product [Fusarium graminearum]
MGALAILVILIIISGFLVGVFYLSHCPGTRPTFSTSSHTSMWQDFELPSHLYIFIWHVPASREASELSRRCPIFYGNVFVLWFDDEKQCLLEPIHQHLDRGPRREESDTRSSPSVRTTSF